ncbi:2Fe-2S iron-sulfur cluster-binding protein [Streptomyces sp. NPDC014724]|uniref:2Fe-2S iron-sulfur cluster-binding protein n=1 Tax=unclassified Streptomyces TaxID=2593676 RepID=UPI0036F7D3D8
MSNEEHNEQHGQREQPQHGGWQPTPQGGEYDAEATAFVHLPPEDLANIPLAAPGQGYVPPMIVPLTPAAGLDPAATGSWVVQAQGRQERGTGAEQPEPGAVHWPDPNQQPQYGYGYPQQEQYPGASAATGQWNFTESAQAAGSTEFGGHADHAAPVDQGGHVDHGGHTGHGGHTDHGGVVSHGGHGGHGDHGGHGGAVGHGDHGGPVGHGGAAGHINHADHTGQSGPADHTGQSGHTGQWTIPVADGDLPEESGEFAASALAAQWYPDRTPPATLPGGAPAPWATQQPAAEPEVEVGPEAPVEPAPGADIEPQHAPEADSAPDAQHSATPSAASPETAPASRSATPTASSVAYRESPQVPEAASETPVTAAEDGPVPAARDTPVLGVDLTQVPAAAPAVDGLPEQRPAEPSTGAAPDPETGTTADTDSDTPLGSTPGEAPLPQAPPLEAQTAEARPAEARSPEEQISAARSHEAEPPGTEPVGDQLLEAHPAEAQLLEAHPVEDQPLDVPSEHPATSYVLHVNGADRPVTDAWIGESLLYVLRERLGLAGAKDGCSQGECGACNVQVDGRLVASCLVPAATTAGSEVRTVEGLAVDGEPSDVQRALAKCGAVQCGFCIPGMAMTIHDLLEGNHAPSELETRQALCGNLCRCSGYRGVLDAVNEVIAGREAGAEPASSDSSSPESDEARIPHQAAAGAGGVQPHSQDGGMA